MPSTISAGTTAGTAIAVAGDTTGNLAFQTNGTTTAMTINTSQGVSVLNCLGVGNATPSTSGAGITFPATQSASSDANTLDDYEEGTWTPDLGGNTTYTLREGKYTKIGNLVYVVGVIIVGTLGTGSATTLSGLPFVTGSQAGRYAGSIAFFSSLAVNAINLIVFNDNSQSTLKFSTVTSSGTGVTSDGASVFGNSTHIQFSMTYRV